MSLKDQAFVVGVNGHPARKAAGIPLVQWHAEVGAGALANAGLTIAGFDSYFCARELASWYAPVIVDLARSPQQRGSRAGCMAQLV